MHGGIDCRTNTAIAYTNSGLWDLGINLMNQYHCWRRRCITLKQPVFSAYRSRKNNTNISKKTQLSQAISLVEKEFQLPLVPTIVPTRIQRRTVSVSNNRTHFRRIKKKVKLPRIHFSMFLFCKYSDQFWSGLLTSILKIRMAASTGSVITFLNSTVDRRRLSQPLSET